MKLLVSLLIIFLSTASFSQLTRVDGYLNLDTTSGNFGQFKIYSASDSGLVKGSYLDSSYFSSIFNAGGETDFYIKIQAFGFKDTLISFAANDTLVHLGNIELAENNLETVDVVWIKPEFERTMDGIKVNVEGTNLQTLNTLFDVLVASPKLTSPDDQSIEIIGKGSPLILVDRQAIISNDELKAIPANMVESIEIITNPSAKYKAQGRGSGVIEVYTKNFHLEGYNMTISANGGVNTQLKPTSGLNIGLNLKKNKFSLNAHLGGNYTETNSFGSSWGASTDSTQRTLTGSSNSESWNSWQYYNVKAAYHINDDQKFTFGVRGHGSLGNWTSDNNTSYLTDGIKDISNTSFSQRSYTWLNNTGFINYTAETDTNKSSLEVNLNFSMKTSNSDATSNNVYEDHALGLFSDFDIQNISKDNPMVGELRINYEHIFDTTGWKLGVGGNYNALYNGKIYDRNNLIDNSWVKDDKFSNSYDYQEQIGAVYTEVTKNWDKVGIRLGARGEYSYLSGYSNSLEKQFIDSVYFLVFPSASIMFSPSDVVGLTFSYSSGINRPQFSNYDPFVRVEDSLNISYGNPYLRPETSHSFNFDLDLFYAYSLSLTYSFTDRPMSDLQFVDDSTFLINSTPWNAKRDNSLYASLNLPLQFDWLSGWNSIWVGYSQYQFTPEFQRDTYTNLTYGLYSYLTFKLPRDYSIMNRLSISKWGSSTSITNTRLNWGLRFSKKMMNNNFQIYLDISSIFPPKYEYYEFAGNYTYGSRNQYEFTSFKLGLWYKFGRLKRAENIQESTSGQSERI